METNAIMEKLAAIERNSLLAAKNVLNFDDVALLTGLSKSHLYKLTCTRQIPHYKPAGKTVYFDKREIESWMEQGRVKTMAESESHAATYQVRKEAAR